MQSALEQYVHVMRLSKDPAVAEHSTLLAIHARDERAARESAALWAQYDPQRMDAQLIAAMLHLEVSADQGMPYLSNAMRLDAQQCLEGLREIASLLSEEGLQHLRRASLRMAQEQPADAPTQLMAALSAATADDQHNAQRLVNAALALQADLSEAILLKARLIQHETNSDTAALRYLDAQILAFPKDRKLRFFYANALIEHGDFDRALKQLKPLLQDKSYGGFSAILIGDVYLQQHHIPEAIQAFKKALAFDNAKASAEYLLGTVAEEQHALQEALQWYLKIEEGPYYMTARLRVIDLLEKERAFEEALRHVEETQPQTLEEHKQLLLRKVALLQQMDRAEDASHVAAKLLESLPQDPDVLEAFEQLQNPLVPGPTPLSE